MEEQSKGQQGQQGLPLEQNKSHFIDRFTFLSTKKYTPAPLLLFEDFLVEKYFYFFFQYHGHYYVLDFTGTNIFLEIGTVPKPPYIVNVRRTGESGQNI